MNREEGFVGTGLKRDEYVGDCSDIDDIIVFTQDGKLMITKVDSKTFIGKDIIHVASVGAFVQWLKKLSIILMHEFP